MNYLAHAYLSFNYDELLIGNMISDFVKGKKQFDFPPAIQKGIKLHRAIDTFTDEHALTKEAKVFLKPAVGLYSGAFIDVVYDHFLANDENQFTDTTLKDFAAKTYNTLQKFHGVLPSGFQVLLPYMTEQNWLYNYKTMWGTQQSFGGIVRRSKYLQSSVEAFSAFEKHYLPLQKCYTNFFPMLKEFAAQQLQAIIQS
ncbi:MAG TPA: ACP phosphodiesterase [Segetibacter sp.]|jgi:acyl carrier protein phosphodiesterase